MKPTPSNVASLHLRLCQTEWGLIMDAAPRQTVAERFEYLANIFADPASVRLLGDQLDPPPCVVLWLMCPPQAYAGDELAIPDSVILSWLNACALAARKNESLQRPSKEDEA